MSFAPAATLHRVAGLSLRERGKSSDIQDRLNFLCFSPSSINLLIIRHYFEINLHELTCLSCKNWIISGNSASPLVNKNGFSVITLYSLFELSDPTSKLDTGVILKTDRLYES